MSVKEGVTLATTTPCFERRRRDVLKELRELRRGIKELKLRHDYSFNLGCVCLGVLVLLLFK